MMRAQRKSLAFTMLELAIVLTIIALITGMGLIAGRGALDSARRAGTERKLDEIERALMDFRVKNNRLPCPTYYSASAGDSFYNEEWLASSISSHGTVCEVYNGPAANGYTVEGAVPAKTLGLPDSYMFDEWGRKIRYAVDMNAAAPGAFLSIRPKEQCSIGVYDFPRDSTGAYSGYSYSRTTDKNVAIYTTIDNAGVPAETFNRDGTMVSQRDGQGAIYVLVSAGENGHGASLVTSSAPIKGSTVSAGELLNCHCDSNGNATNYYGKYVQADVFTSDTADEYFDDIVRFKKRYQMQTPSDLDNFGDYDGPQLLTVDTENGMALYSNHCGYMRSERIDADGSAVNPTASGKTAEAVFSPKNDIFEYTTTGNCNEYIYNLTNDTYPSRLTGGLNYEKTVTNSISGSAICGSYQQTKFLLAPKPGLMMVSFENDPYFEIWQYSPATHRYSLARTDGNFILNDSGTYGVSRFYKTMAVTQDGRYLFLHDESGTSELYVLTPDADGVQYKYMASQPDFDGSNTVYDAAFSPDGKYLAVLIKTGVEIWIIDRSTDSFTHDGASDPDASSWGFVGSPMRITWSRDGNYIAVTADLSSGGNVRETTEIWRVIYSNSQSELTFAEIMGRDAPDMDYVSTGRGDYVTQYDNIGETYNDANSSSDWSKSMFSMDSRYFIQAAPLSQSVNAGGNGTWPFGVFRIVGNGGGGATGNYSLQMMYLHDGSAYYGFMPDGSSVPGFAVRAMDIAH